jgi:RNA polymerase sigma-70 factor (ECF subfamily)
MDHTSLSLLDRACRGESDESWRLLAEVYSPVLRRWLVRYDLQTADADDLVQDVLVVVSRDLAKFQHNGRPGAFRAWLKTILVNRLRNFWRSRNYRPTATGDSDFLRSLEELEDPRSELSQAWDREHDGQVIRLLTARVEGRFSESTQAAFRRIVFDEAAPEDVARELGLSLNAVVIAKCRVLKALRQEGRGLLGNE